MYNVVIVNDAEVDIRQIVSFIAKESGSNKIAQDYCDKITPSVNSLKQFSEGAQHQDIK